MSNIVNNIIREIGHFLKLSADDYCDLESTMYDDTLVFNNGAMASILRFNGFYSSVSVDMLAQMFNHISNDLSELYLKKGYSMIFKFTRGEPDNEYLRKIIERKKSTAKRLELDLDDIIEEQYEQFADGVFKENIYITLITKSTVLDKLDIQMESSVRAPIDIPAEAMNIYIGRESLYGKHSAYVEKVLGAFQNKNFYADVEKLNIVEALQMIKSDIEHEDNSDWMPDIANEEYNNVLLPNNSSPTDFSHFLPRTLGSQLMHHGFLKPSFYGLPKSTQVIGENLVISTNMQTAPKNPMLFNDLFVMLNKISAVDEQGYQASIPYSISFIIQSQASLPTKDFLGGFLKGMSEHNKSVYQTLTEIKKAGEHFPVVSFQFTASTWAKNTEAGANSLKERFLRLSSAIESWGGISLTHTNGDDIKVWRNNVPALSTEFVGNKAITLLPEALMCMPVHRPLSPFGDRGSIIYRSVDGKLSPFELLSSLTHDHQICVTGSMGSGKSVMLSNLIFEYVLNPKNITLPKIMMVDVGYSAEGIFDLFANALPPHKRHLVAKRVMENTRENAINPFDFKRGLREPLPSEQELTKSFLRALTTKGLNEADMAQMEGFINEAYKLTIARYMSNTDQATPKRYSVGVSNELDDLIIELHPFDFETSERILPTGGRKKSIISSSLPENLLFKEMANLFHVLASQTSERTTRDKYMRASALSWRMAMPNLEDFLIIAGEEQLAQTFPKALCEKAQQQISDAIRNYPCFSTNTAFDVDTADLLVLELQQVIDTNNPYKTGLFYQLCFFLFARYFKFDDQHLETHVPNEYHEFYKKWNKNIQSTPKFFVIDEFKNVQSSPSAMVGIEKSALEFRKHGMRITYAGQLASQFVTNDPRNAGKDLNLLDIMSYHIELSPLSEGSKNLDLLATSYNMPEAVQKEMSKIRRDDNIGTVFYMATRSAKYGVLHQFLNNKIGNKMLWVCSTRPVDRTMRKSILERATNQMEAVSALALYFGSSAEKILEAELNRITDMKGINDTRKTELAQELYNTTAKKALDYYREYRLQKRTADMEAEYARIHRWDKKEEVETQGQETEQEAS